MREGISLSEIGPTAATEQLSQRLEGELRLLGDVAERPGEDPLVGYLRPVGEWMERDVGKQRDERSGPLLVALECSRVPPLHIELTLPARLQEWLLVVEPHWSLVEQRVEAAAQAFVRERLDRYEGVLQVHRPEPRSIPTVSGILVGFEGARPVTGGLGQALAPAWHRTLEQTFGLAHGGRRLAEPPEARRTAVFERWRAAQRSYTTVLLTGGAAHADVKKVARHALAREGEYLGLWAAYANGTRTGPVETRIALRGAAEPLRPLAAAELQRCIERAVHAVLPRQQIFVIECRAFGRSVDVRLHHPVGLSPAEGDALRRDLGRATIAAARELAPNRIPGELRDVAVKQVAEGWRGRVDRLMEAIPVARVKALGQGLERTGDLLVRGR